MTYPDPANPLPNPPPGRNPPRYRDTDDGVGMGVIVGGLVAIVLFLGVMFYVVAPSNDTASNPAPTTVGQGGTPAAPPAATPPAPPAREQDSPAPITPTPPAREQGSPP
jgi:hypothetical protein